MIDLVFYLDPVATEEFISGLLEGEGFVLSGFFEVRGSNAFVFVLEKQLVGFLKALADFLHGLRSEFSTVGPQ